MTMRRREAMKALGALAGAAGTGKFLSACDDGGPGPGGPTGITTWVFLMMENRSYDHYLGARAMLEGKPGDGLRADMSNPDRDGVAVPVWPAPPAGLCVSDPPHGWGASRTQLNGGANDGFVIAHQGASGTDVAPMQYMTRDILPVTWALADAYTTCDRWFSSVLGPTLPNRMYWHAGTSNGAMSNDEVLGGAFEGVPTIYHRLEDRGVDWAYYFGDLPVLGVLEDIPTDGRIKRFYYDFLDDAAAGTLPPVVYIDPQFAWNDDHPPHHPGLGQQLISAVYTALATSPQWPNCMLVVTYDENGGFYDHVAPGTVSDDHAAQGFDQLGFRVPTMVIGPYAKPGHVSSVSYDHASALKHLQSTFGTAPLTMRVDAATDLSDCIDLDRLARGEPAAPVALPAIEVDEELATELCVGQHLREAPHHDVIELADALLAQGRLDPRLDLRRYGRDQIYGIAEYLDRHGRGRIRRRRGPRR